MALLAVFQFYDPASSILGNEVLLGKPGALGRGDGACSCGHAAEGERKELGVIYYLFF